MLKNVGIIILLSISSNVFAHEFEINIFDQVTEEVAVEKCANETELNTVTNYLNDLNDDSIKFTVKKINLPSSIMAVKRGGGEGGTD